MAAPLVSIMTPCYNSAGTLPLALASLLAQDYEDWECVLIDDGSTDGSREIVERARDPRIKCFRFGLNRGRGAARQAALERAKGEYLCMLDADDWMYPWRIRREVETMRDKPKVALVSAGVAVTDEHNELIGVRGRAPAGKGPTTRGPVRRLGPPPVVHASSMVRMGIAKQTGYDPILIATEDIDFILRLLLDRRYCLLSEIVYVYSEHASVTESKILDGHRRRKRVFYKHKHRFPFASRLNVWNSVAKSCAYRAAFAVGLGKRAVARRSRKPTSAEMNEFRRARDVVLATAQRMFG